MDAPSSAHAVAEPVARRGPSAATTAPSPPTMGGPHQRAAGGSPGAAAVAEDGAPPQALSEWQLFVLQTGAVRRAWCQNACLLGLPAIFCVLLLVLQRLVNGTLSGSEDFRCGCRCLSCCDWVAVGGPTAARGGNISSNASAGVTGAASANATAAGSQLEWQCYTATEERPCSPYALCKSRDPTECGAQYSTISQIAFCDVRYPTTWPAILQVPPEQYRPGAHSAAAGQRSNTSAVAGGTGAGGGAGGRNSSAAAAGATPPIVAPFTGSDRAAASALSARIVPPGGDVGVGGRILRDLLDAQQRLRAANSTANGTANSTTSGSGGGGGGGDGGNPLLAALFGVLGSGGTAAAAAVAGGGDGGGGNVDLCDPRVDVAALLRQSAGGAVPPPPAPPAAANAAAANATTPPPPAAATTAAAAAATAAALTPAQLSDALSSLAQIFSDYDLLLGTAAEVPYTNLIEPALIVGSRVLGAAVAGSGGSSSGGSSSGLLGASGGGDIASLATLPGQREGADQGTSVQRVVHRLRRFYLGLGRRFWIKACGRAGGARASAAFAARRAAARKATAAVAVCTADSTSVAASGLAAAASAAPPPGATMVSVPAAAAGDGDVLAAGGAGVDQEEGEDVRAERERVERLWQRHGLGLGLAAPPGATAEGVAAGAAAPGGDEEGGEPPALLLRNVRRVFPGKGASGKPLVAVRGMSLAVGARETLGLLGPNGAGKTTTLRMMQGIMEPSSGSVYVCGLPLATEAPAVARLVGICPQHDVLWPTLTGREHARLFGRIKALPLYHLSRNCSALGRTDTLVLSQLSCALNRGLGLPELLCATWEPAWRPNAPAVEEELFCGWASSECPATATATAVGVHVNTSAAAGSAGGGSRRLLQAPPAAAVVAPAAAANATADADAAGDYRIVQFPSAVYDWRGGAAAAGPEGMRLTVLTLDPTAGHDDEAARFVRECVSPAAKQVYCLNGTHSYEVPRSAAAGGLAGMFRTLTAAVARQQQQQQQRQQQRLLPGGDSHQRVWGADGDGDVDGDGERFESAGGSWCGSASGGSIVSRRDSGSGAAGSGGPPLPVRQQSQLEPCKSVAAVAGEGGPGVAAGEAGGEMVAGAAPSPPLALLDWAVCSASLESVFVRVARDAGATVEAAGS
ncbi:ABC transporter A family member 8 [Tetrabaena socialis]|uniref:ABC transporter A family member 8 n=1 Tax=Tetrabaena socialis TaxID=47790 RepID=A0A2J8A135_9CHLO|nr:ABC transporter A family member 8 [Tetrabaena socialis]|eukprot:PNH06224.1 ABC transporter A family member 8 [Tetrabaena socialis]